MFEICHSRHEVLPSGKGFLRKENTESTEELKNHANEEVKLCELCG